MSSSGASPRPRRSSGQVEHHDVDPGNASCSAAGADWLVRYPIPTSSVRSSSQTVSPPSTVAGSSIRPTTGTPTASRALGRLRLPRRPSLPGEQEHRSLAADEGRVVGVDRVRVAGIVLRDDDLRACLLQQTAERLVLRLRRRDIRRGAPAYASPRARPPAGDVAPERAEARPTSRRCLTRSRRARVDDRVLRPTAVEQHRAQRLDAEHPHREPRVTRRAAEMRCEHDVLDREQPSSTSGSRSNTSSAAPRSLPPRSASTSARSSTTGPREVLTSTAAGASPPAPLRRQVPCLVGQRDVEADDVGLGERAREGRPRDRRTSPPHRMPGELRRLPSDPARATTSSRLPSRPSRA